MLLLYTVALRCYLRVIIVICIPGTDVYHFALQLLLLFVVLLILLTGGLRCCPLPFRLFYPFLRVTLIITRQYRLLLLRYLHGPRIDLRCNYACVVVI